MIRALTFGVFDLLHYGHIRLLARVKAMADWVTVGLPTDELVAASGKRQPFFPLPIRREMLVNLRTVDEVVEYGGPMDGHGRVKVVAAKIEMVQRQRIDLVVMGDDWRGEYDFLRPYCDVVYLDRTPGISTRLIREQLGADPRQTG